VGEYKRDQTVFFSPILILTAMNLTQTKSEFNAEDDLVGVGIICLPGPSCRYLRLISTCIIDGG